MRKILAGIGVAVAFAVLSAGPAFPQNADDRSQGFSAGQATFPYVYDGTNFDRLRSASGTTGVLVVNTEGTKASYRAGSAAFASVATATDICTITGSATKTVRVTQVEVSGVQTTAGVISLFLIKRGAANSGGTSADITEVPMDSASAAATATVLTYTANPTINGTVGNIWAGKILVPAPASVADSALLADYTWRNTQAVVLRGIAQVLAVNLGGVTVTGGSFHCNFEWTEE